MYETENALNDYIELRCMYITLFAILKHLYHNGDNYFHVFISNFIT